MFLSILHENMREGRRFFSGKEIYEVQTYPVSQAQGGEPLRAAPTPAKLAAPQLFRTSRSRRVLWPNAQLTQDRSAAGAVLEDLHAHGIPEGLHPGHGEVAVQDIQRRRGKEIDAPNAENNTP